MNDENKSSKGATRRIELAGSADGLHPTLFDGKVHELMQASPCDAAEQRSAAK